MSWPSQSTFRIGECTDVQERTIPNVRAERTLVTMVLVDWAVERACEKEYRPLRCGYIEHITGGRYADGRNHHPPVYDFRTSKPTSFLTS
jgi:hypothetical protein